MDQMTPTPKSRGEQRRREIASLVASGNNPATYNPAKPWRPSPVEVAMQRRARRA